MLYKFEDKSPQLNGNNIFIAKEACLYGAVIIENNVCILPQAVIRADNDVIYIGEGTNVQDGTVIHTDKGIQVKIGKGVTIGHLAMLHGCKIGDNSLIGINAVVLNNAVIGNNCMVGANSLILEGQNVPDNSLVLGSPGKVVRQLTEEEIEKLKQSAQHYVDKISRFKKDLKSEDGFLLGGE